MTTASTPRVESSATQPTLRGRFVWYDLMTTDVQAATAFYTKVAGWGTQDFDMGPSGNYQMWTVGGAMIGGVVQLTPEMGPPGTPPHWMGSVGVPNVDDAAMQAESLGGRVLVPPTDIPDIGRYAVIADPQGAVIGLYASLQPEAPGEFAPKVGEFSWHELATSDREAAFSFYSALFGWERMGEFDMGAPVGVYLMYGQNGGRPADAPQALPYGGMYTSPPDMPMPPSWCYYIRVPSARDAVETVKALGGHVLNGPMEVPGGDLVAQCMDPQGAMFAVHSTKQG
jgi:hypothetical protein